MLFITWCGQLEVDHEKSFTCRKAHEEVPLFVWNRKMTDSCCVRTWGLWENPKNHPPFGSTDNRPQGRMYCSLPSVEIILDESSQAETEVSRLLQINSTQVSRDEGTNLFSPISERTKWERGKGKENGDNKSKLVLFQKECESVFC